MTATPGVGDDMRENLQCIQPDPAARDEFLRRMDEADREYRMLKRIRLSIKDAGLRQKDVALALKISPDKLSKSLKGVRRFSSLEIALLAEKCDVRVSWLLGTEEAIAADLLVEIKRLRDELAATVPLERAAYRQGFIAGGISALKEEK